MTKALLVCSLALGTGLTAYGQDEFPRFAFNLGAGFTTPTEDVGDRLDRGWNVGAGAGVNFHPNFALMLDFTYNSFNINGSTLNAVGFPDGDVQMWSLSLNPVVHTNPRGPVDVYFTGGGGLYRWEQNFTAPSTATFTGFDPYLGVFYPVAVPTETVLSSYSVLKPGFNGGMGLAFGTRWDAEFYTEARFHRMFLGNDRYADTIPVTFGIRF